MSPTVTSHFRRGSCAALPLLIGAALSLAHPFAARAAEATALPPVSVDSDKMPAGCPLDTTTIDKKKIDAQSILGATDSAAILSAVPGVNLQTGGGISSLPIIHGMNDDRNSTLVDGMPLTSACPNHMNPAMSYIAPGNAGHVSVISGISPVSAGGDSIGGSITIDPAAPMFGTAADKVDVHGSAGTYVRSNGGQIGVNGDIAAATNQYSVGYNGSWTRAGNYRDGDGDGIRASKFENQSHNATLAARNDDAQVTVRAGHQMTPFEGFANQRMDLLGNTSNYLNSGFSGSYGWGNLDAKAYWQNAQHYMNFLRNDRNISASTAGMPMNTNGTDAGYSLKGEIPLSKDDILRIGNELHIYRLSDWWPPTSGTAGGMMSPNTFWNINHGKRDVLGTYGELEKSWTPQMTSVFGLRNDTVWMNTGNVQGYSNNATANYARDSAAFNAQDHHKTDVNFSLTATTRYEASTTSAYELGLARKTESPNLYERYAWSTGTMAASMTNWLGNGTYYVGNVNLRPETAYTTSVSGDWHDAAKADWDVKVTPYYTYVQDYIGVNKISPSGTITVAGINEVQFANHDAQMFGFDLSGKKSLIKEASYGNLDLGGTVGLVKGMQVNNGNSLYHMQPLNADISLTHTWGGLTNVLEARLVDDKSVTNPLQNEGVTPGFAILNWRTSYQLETITFAVGIDNILDKQYYDPNGGAYLSGWRASGSSNSGVGNLPAPGRSYNAGVTVKF